MPRAKLPSLRFTATMPASSWPPLTKSAQPKRAGRSSKRTAEDLRQHGQRKPSRPLCFLLLLKVVLLLLFAPRGAAGELGFDSTLGYPGEGPTAACVRVDEASGGVMAMGPAPTVLPLGPDWPARRERKPRVKLWDKC